MGRKLSPAQCALLAKMASGQIAIPVTERYSRLVLSSEPWGRVSWGTFNALMRRGLIEGFRPAAHSIDLDYRITDAGRAALAARKTEGE